MIQYKFVNGQADEAHEKAIEEACKQGYAVKLMTSNPSHVSTEGNQFIIVLMEKLA